MYESIIERLGLTKNETLTYIALLKLGKSKSSTIVQEAKISSGKIYETLYKLIEKGIVKTLTERGVKYFIANDPKALLLYINEKERELEKRKKDFENILPELSKISNSETKKEVVSLIKGFRGITPQIYEALEKCKSEIKVMGVRSSKDIKFNNFWKKYHVYRTRLKKNAKMLFSDSDTDYWKFFKKLKLTEVKETLSLSPSAIMIVGDNVFIFSYDQDITCIHIASESITKSFNSFFDSLWKST